MKGREGHREERKGGDRTKLRGFRGRRERRKGKEREGKGREGKGKEGKGREEIESTINTH